MKRLYLAIIFIILLTPLFANASDSGFGPELFGLQLGMTEPEVKNSIAQYAKKHNIPYDGRDTMLLGNVKLLDIAFLGTKYARMIQIAKEVFGIDDLLDRKFLQQFIDHYNIPNITPQESDGKIKYVYKNDKDGYEVNIYQNYILLNTIKKRANRPPTFE